MPLISDIKPQKKLRSGEPRFNIFIDGLFGFSLPAETLVKSGLKIGQQLSAEEIDKLVKENDYLKYFNLVLKFISFRPRSGKEILDWLKRKDVGKSVQVMILAKLKHLGYLDDEEFVKWWIEQRTTFRPSGKRAIEMELRQKGISREVIEHGTHNMEHGTKEYDLAKKAIEKKLSLWKNLPPDKFRQKLSSFLARRGFSWETIGRVIKETD